MDILEHFRIYIYIQDIFLDPWISGYTMAIWLHLYGYTINILYLDTDKYLENEYTRGHWVRPWTWLEPRALSIPLDLVRTPWHWVHPWI